MQPIKDWWKASEVFFNDIEKVLLYVLLVLLAAKFGGVLLAILAIMVVPLIGTWMKKSKLICTNSYKSGKCGNVVSPRKNFCDRCGNEVPDELKL